MSSELDAGTDESVLFRETTAPLKQARNTARKVANTIVVQTCWQIGRHIAEQELTDQGFAGYGKHVIINFSRYLSDCFSKGFSEENLWNMRHFYHRIPDVGLSTHCVGNLQLSSCHVQNLNWTSIQLIMRPNYSNEPLNRGEDNNPASGIILFAEKGQTMVEFTVLNENRQVFAFKQTPFANRRRIVRNNCSQNCKLLDI